jgi:hyaluronan synthase
VKRFLPAGVAGVVWLVIGIRAAQLSTRAGVVTLTVFALFCIRLLLAWRSRPEPGETPALDVSVVLPMFNEDPLLLRRSLESLARQTYLPRRVWIVDDGSNDLGALATAEGFRGPFDVRVIRCEVNRGKREAQAEAFRRDRSAQVFVTADSDTVFHQDAILEGLKPFANADVTGVAGLVRPINRNRNLLTRLQDAEYLSSFLLERASLSSLQGSVLVTSGGLAFYRADVIHEVLVEYVTQTFAGRPVHTGDDRMLTQLCLQRGRVVLQHTAIADTAVPERLSHLLRQRVRWSRSFWVNSLWVFGNLRPNAWPYWLVFYYLASVAALFLSLVVVLIAAPELGVRFVSVFLGMVATLSYLRAARLLAVSLPGVTGVQQFSTFVMVGPAVLFNLVVLLPVRLWALLRIRDVGRWGTRQTVEVVATGLIGLVGAAWTARCPPPRPIGSPSMPSAATTSVAVVAGPVDPPPPARQRTTATVVPTGPVATPAPVRAFAARTRPPAARAMPVRAPAVLTQACPTPTSKLPSPPASGAVTAPLIARVAPPPASSVPDWAREILEASSGELADDPTQAVERVAVPAGRSC